ncbi:hypothetical protein A9Q96_01340 [Rhodobacterales bacterium 52_120_T64]|nr:hypothetical protein A9Q96_01340 [Rhodobacterales bacterium 52_120_T64]
MNERNASAVAFEFVIGVTGHRDPLPEQIPALKATVAGALEGLVGRFKSTPISVVTGLAEGADTIVTEVALEMGLDVTALLPMPKPIYEADFKGEALTVFRNLINDPRIKVLELPIIGEHALADMSDQSYRDDQYDLLKNYLVRRSNLLLALWDGEITHLRGGTSDVVLSYLCGEVGLSHPSKVSASQEIMDDCGEIAICIRTPRKLTPKADVPSGYSFLVSNSTCVTFSELETIPQYYFDRWSGLDDYALERFSPDGENIPVYPLIDPEDACLTDHTKVVENEFLRADQLAMASQKMSDTLFKCFGLIAGAMGLFFLVYAKLAALKIFLALYIALFFVGYIAFRMGAKKRWLARHLACRALAETLRVQFFLLMAGAGHGFNVRRMLRLTSVNRFEGFAWLQDAARFAEPLFETVSEEEERLEAVRKNWVEDQANYFSKKLDQMHVQHARLEVIKSILMAGSILGALALVFFKKSLLHMEMAGYDGKALLVFAMGLLPLWLAVWELYQGKMATRELIWQYTNQRRYFAAANHQLIDVPGIASKRRVVFNLAEQALAEIYLWSAHRYHREHEPPAAG